MKRLALVAAFAMPGLAGAQVVIAPDPPPLLDYAGLQGLLAPSYDRVNGLSLPIGATVTFGGRAIELQPTLTYRSRLGVIDPAVIIRLWPDQPVRVEARVGYDTRTNDAWIYGDLVNSVTTFFAGLDTRNYFRSKGGEGRIFGLVSQPGLSFEPYVGGRYESVSSITAIGNVWVVKGKTDVERSLRLNPPVEEGSIGSALLGFRLHDTSGVVTSRLAAELEQSLTTMGGTSSFTQLTLDGRLAFPTFKTQQLRFRAHGVVTLGDSVPRARYAYVGGSGTLPVVELLELGGPKMLFFESRYLVPVEGVVLPLVKTPVLTLLHIMGSAGITALPSLEQEIGVGLGMSMLHVEVVHDVAGTRGTKLGFFVSLGS